MSKGIYNIIDGITRKVNNQYIVVDGMTKKIIKSYTIVDGVTKNFFEIITEPFIFTGTYTVTDVTVSNQPMKLYTITDSGTLTLNSEAQCWMCGGGGGGGQNYHETGVRTSSGGGGGGGYTQTENLSAGIYPIIIGSGGTSDQAGGATTIGALTVQGGNPGSDTGNGGDGGSGGGSGTGIDGDNSLIISSPGNGAGTATKPFGITSLSFPCAGGSGGALGEIYGYKGGSNGSDALTSVSTNDVDSNYRTQGAQKGGGKGGGYHATYQSGSSATYYGSGGGGSGNYRSVDSSVACSGVAGGSGYQGVVYILMPA